MQSNKNLMSDHSSFSSLTSSYGCSVCRSPSVLSPLSSPERCFYTPDGAYQSAMAMPAILENGRKVFGPPNDYTGARPSFECELYITHLARNLDERQFLAWLHRCGAVYEFRLMMDSCVATRGYAFVRYTNERDALAAYELLNFVFMCNERLNVYRSQGKNRLYISNIPKEIPLLALKAGFQKVFPDMQNCSLHATKTMGNQNRDNNSGYAFLEFIDHETALMAKKRTTPGRVRMWDCDLKVQWAKPKVTHNKSPESNSNEKRNEKNPLYVRDEIALPWQNDNCAKLRLFCLANDWCIPVVVYGRCFRQYDLQYGAILLKHPTSGDVSCLLMELVVQRDVFDIHELMCEIAVQLLERNRGFPKQNYALRVLGGARALIIYTQNSILELITKATTYFCSPTAICELATALHVLSQHSSESILLAYKRSFLDVTSVRNSVTISDRQNVACFYSIFPKFRNNSALHNVFNDTEITFLLALASNNYCYCRRLPGLITMRRQMHNESQYFSLRSQRHLNQCSDYVLRFVSIEQVETRDLYHPAQKMNLSPIWISGHTYQKSMYK